MTDPYTVLGLEPGASEKDIRRAYRDLAANHHPDKGGEDEKFMEVKAAHDFLMDKNNREMYEKFGVFNVNHRADVIKSALGAIQKSLGINDNDNILGTAKRILRNDRSQFQNQIAEMESRIKQAAHILANLTSKEGKPLPEDDPVHLMLQAAIDEPTRQKKVLEYNSQMATEALEFLEKGYSLKGASNSDYPSAFAQQFHYVTWQ